MRRLHNTKDMTEQEWLEHRKKGIGGSDASIILGINKWKKPLELYMEKIGEWEPADLSDNQAVHFGHKLEQVVAEEFAERTGYKVQRNNFILQHDLYDFMFANIDREIIHPTKGRGVLEIKTTSAWNRGEWTAEEIPPQYMVQVQHYLAVTGYNYAYIAVLIGGNQYEHYYVDRDDELIEILIEKEREFWEDHIEPRIPPALDYETDSAELLNRMYPQETDSEAVQLDDDAGDLLREIEAEEREIKDLKSRVEIKKNQLKNIIREHEKAVHDYGIVTWKTTKASEYVPPAKLREKYPNIYEELKEQRQASRRFAIKFKQPREL